MHFIIFSSLNAELPAINFNFKEYSSSAKNSNGIIFSSDSNTALVGGGKALNFCHIEKNRFIIIHTMVNSEW